MQHILTGLAGLGRAAWLVILLEAGLPHYTGCNTTVGVLVAAGVLFATYAV
jgi:hypothetical protein